MQRAFSQVSMAHIGTLNTGQNDMSKSRKGLTWPFDKYQQRNGNVCHQPIHQWQSGVIDQTCITEALPFKYYHRGKGRQRN